MNSQIFSWLCEISLELKKQESSFSFPVFNIERRKRSMDGLCVAWSWMKCIWVRSRSAGASSVTFMLVPHGHEVLGRIVGENAHE